MRSTLDLHSGGLGPARGCVRIGSLSHAFSLHSGTGRRYSRAVKQPNRADATSAKPAGEYIGDKTDDAGVRRGRDADSESESALRFLARASALLAESLDYDTTLASVARMAVPYLADCCIVDMLEDDGQIRRLAVAHGEPEKAGLARELEQHPPEPTSEQGVPNVLRTGRPELRSVVDDSLLPSLARNPEHLRVLQELRPRSHIAVPLTARGRILGAMTFVATDQSGRRYTEGDLVLVSDLAHRASLAVDNARLYREAQDAIRLRTDFISIAAHELKTPMSSLRLAAQASLRRLVKTGEIAPDQIRSYMHTIDTQSEKLERLISQLLDTSRIEAGRLVLAPEDVDIRELVEEVVGSART